MQHTSGTRCTCSIFPWIPCLMAAADSHRSGPSLPTFFLSLPLFLPPRLYSSLSKHEISSCMRTTRHGVCRHAHVPNSHSPIAAVTLWESPGQKTKDAPRNARPSPPFATPPRGRREGRKGSEGRPRALTCTRFEPFCRAFSKRGGGSRFKTASV